MLTHRAARGIRLALLTVFACVATLPLIGCVSPPSISAPAFQKDVDAVRADHDAAIFTLRSETNASIEQLRSDVVAARSAGEKAFADAINSGKSIGEATADRVRAETAVAIQAAKDAMAEQKAKTDAAIAEADAKAKAARDLAKQNGEGSPGWLTWVLGLLGTTGVGGILTKVLLVLYDRKPFVGSDGTTMAEAPLVDALARALGAGKPARPAAPPTSAAPPTV